MNNLRIRSIEVPIYEDDDADEPVVKEWKELIVAWQGIATVLENTESGMIPLDEFCLVCLDKASKELFTVKISDNFKVKKYEANELRRGDKGNPHAREESRVDNHTGNIVSPGKEP